MPTLGTRLRGMTLIEHPQSEMLTKMDQFEVAYHYAPYHPLLELAADIIGWARLMLPGEETDAARAFREAIRPGQRLTVNVNLSEGGPFKDKASEFARQVIEESIRRRSGVSV